MERFKNIPNWVISKSLPAFYDTESGTAIEQTARLHGTIKDLITDYNNFVSSLTEEINKFIDSVEKDQDDFEVKITKVIHDYLHMLDDKIKSQDLKIDEAVKFMTSNISQSVTTLLNEMKENGELDTAVLNSFYNLDNRVKTIENTEYQLVYENGTENLILEKVVKEVE